MTGDLFTSQSKYPKQIPEIEPLTEPSGRQSDPNPSDFLLKILSATRQTRWHCIWQRNFAQKEVVEESKSKIDQNNDKTIYIRVQPSFQNSEHPPQN
jgi:hypothetical protein